MSESSHSDYNLTPKEKVAELKKEFSTEKSLDIAETLKDYYAGFNAPTLVKYWKEVIKILKTKQS